MCGRYTQGQKKVTIVKKYDVARITGEIVPSFNVCPGQHVAAIVGHTERRLGVLRWGLPSPRAGGRPLINARAETLAEKPSFARLLSQRRCLILADGFYEWRQDEGRKQPVYIHMKDRTPFAFAGLWDAVSLTTGKRAYGTIITTRANKLISAVHHRMPVILPPSAIASWLDPRFTAIDSLLLPYPDGAMTWYPVSDAVNSTANDGPDLVRPLALPGADRENRK